MLDIMAGVDSKDCIALFGRGLCKARFSGDSAPRAVSLSLLLSGPGARHHCQYGPDGQARGEILADMVLVVQTAANCGFSTVAVLQGRRHLLRGSEAHPYGH